MNPIICFLHKIKNMNGIFMFLLIRHIVSSSASVNNEDPCASTENSKTILDDEFVIALDNLRDIVFGDVPWQNQLENVVLDTGHEILTRRSTNFVPHPWHENKDGLQERLVTYDMHPNSTFVKTSQVKEKQTFLKQTEDSFAVKRIVANEGFMFSDAFYVEVRFCAAQKESTTRVIVVAEIHSNSSFYFLVSGPAEEGTYAGLAEYYDGLKDTLKEWVARKEEKKAHDSIDSRQNQNFPGLEQSFQPAADSNEAKNGKLFDSIGNRWIKTGEGEIKISNATIRAIVTRYWSSHRLRRRRSKHRHLFESTSEYFSDNHSSSKVHWSNVTADSLILLLVVGAFVAVGCLRNRPQH